MVDEYHTAKSGRNHKNANGSAIWGIAMQDSQRELIARFSATALFRDLANIRAEAAKGPIGITSHKRTELVMMSSEIFASLSAPANDTSAERLEAKLSIVLDTIDTHVLIVDHELKVRRINRALNISLGLGQESYVDQPVTRILPPATASFIVRRLREVEVTGRSAEFEFASVINPGRIIHARIVPWPGGVAYFSDDVTDRLSAMDLEATYDALRLARVALGHSGAGTVGVEGTISNSDEALARILAVPPEALDGSKFIALFDPANRSAIEAALRNPTLDTQIVDVLYVYGGVDLRRGRLALTPYFLHDGKMRHAFILEEA